MTMPHERLRSIGWGAELLAELAGDPQVPEALQSQASRLARSYPSIQELLELLEIPGQTLPTCAGEAIDEARAPFDELLGLGVEQHKTRKNLAFTLRHFPLKGWSLVADRSARLGRLDEWLAPDPGW